MISVVLLLPVSRSEQASWLTPSSRFKKKPRNTDRTDGESAPKLLGPSGCTGERERERESPHLWCPKHLCSTSMFHCSHGVVARPIGCLQDRDESDSDAPEACKDLSRALDLCMRFLAGWNLLLQTTSFKDELIVLARSSQLRPHAFSQSADRMRRPPFCSKCTLPCYSLLEWHMQQVSFQHPYFNLNEAVFGSLICSLSSLLGFRIASILGESRHMISVLGPHIFMPTACLLFS